jgi:hypothetical protein
MKALEVGMLDLVWEIDGFGLGGRAACRFGRCRKISKHVWYRDRKTIIEHQVDETVVVA